MLSETTEANKEISRRNENGNTLAVNIKKNGCFAVE